jgi:hypothetical protein
MYAGSFVLDGKRVEIRREPAEGFIDPIVLDPTSQYFNGSIFKQYPQSTRYFAGGPRNEKLHRAVWARAFGPIPAGCHIHHRDHVPENNLLSNLECMPRHDHLSETWKRTHAAKTEHFTAYAKERLLEWHRSDAAKIMRLRTAERQTAWLKHRRSERTCVECGVLFVGLDRAGPLRQIYCGGKCRVRAYQKRKAAGLLRGHVVHPSP